MMNDPFETRHLNMLKTAFGPEILKWIEDPEVIEIMLNPDGKLWIEKFQQEPFFTQQLIPKEQAENIIKLIASFKNKVVNDLFPSLAAELPFGSCRFQGWLFPIVERPCFTLRKHSSSILTLADYEASGALSAEQRKQLESAVLSRKNLIIAGGTGSGKTTFANALLALLAHEKDRILVLEDLPELQIHSPNLVKMVTSETLSMRELVKGSLRMRPDRIIIGEVRDGAALDLLKAWNTGHPGGICTLHANSGESVPDRLEDLIREVSVTVPQNLIAQAVDLIVFIERDKNGKRKIRSIQTLESLKKA